MGWEDCGTDSNGRPIGYAFEAICDHPGCNKEIHRGLVYACGPTHDEGTYYCEKYFCYEHLYHVERERSSICAECLKLFKEEDSMFGKKKTKKRLVKVIVACDSHEGHSFERVIDIPDGCTFQAKDYSRDRMYNSDGYLVGVYDWRAGYTRIYEFIYEE